MNAFLAALQFLTIIPVPQRVNVNGQEQGNSTVYYPLIGLILGCFLVLTPLLFATISMQIQAVMVLIVWVIMTGGLHLDGLADCADAWVGGMGSKQRSLEIMKDPAAGPVAVTVLVLVLLLKWATIHDSLDKQTVVVLLLTPVMGRLSILILMLSSHYIRPHGLGEKMLANLPETAVKILSVSGLLLGLYFLGLLATCFMLITIIIINHQAKQRLGGVTGDVYGATVELVEVSILLGAAL